MRRLDRVALLPLALLALALAGSALAHPGSGIAVDRRGRVFFVDTGAGVFVIDGEGRLEPHPGEAFHWMTLDPESRFGDTPLPHLPTSDLRAEGRDPMVILSSDYPAALGADGALYFPEPGGGGRLRLVRLTAAGERSDFVLLPDQSEGAPLRWLNGVGAGADGSIYYTENAAVRRIGRDGELTTIVSRIEVPDCRPLAGLPPELAPYLRGLAIGDDGTVYVAATGCGALVRIGSDGEIATVLRASGMWAPTGVALHGDDVYALEYLHTAEDPGDRRVWVPRVRRLAADGTVTLLVEIRRDPVGP